MSQVKVSVVTPTYGRHHFLKLAHRCFMTQTLDCAEWLVLDDSPQACEELSSLNTDNIHYCHTGTRMSIGAKRNWLIQRASGDIIVHFDDDDYYAPNYLETVIDALKRTEADLINLRGHFIYHSPSKSFAYWDLLKREGLHIKLGSSDGMQPIMLDASNNMDFAYNHLGYGFSYVYYKKVWENAGFPDMNLKEDGFFAWEAQKRFRLDRIFDTTGICLHILHRSNTSKSYPQYLLPEILIRRLFPEDVLRSYAE